MRELEKQYDPQSVEAKWARRWAEQPFTADAHSDKPPFCIVMPPPNVTGDLHLGHSFPNTLADALIRFKRMQGYEALFQPGTDHAGISTQVQVERALRKEGKTKHDLGREEFLARVWVWKERYGGIIVKQLQRLGISADWSRMRFTMDEGLSRAVRHQFVRLYHDGLAYRGERIVNWDPASQTTLSELEVERSERPGKLYTLAYALEGGASINVATVRPETIFADVAVAVHPDDERYKALLGKGARIPLTERWIPIIADEAVERDFGTGALKITPAHDPTDFEIGLRHNLERPSVIDLDAKLVGDLVPERFRGLDRFEARGAVVAALEAEGSVLETKDHSVALGLSQRTGEPVEPLLSLQWFVATDSAARRVLKGLDEGDITIVPERYAKVNRDWLANLRHWNISRQLWWGHQIPAWYDGEGNIYVPDPENPDLDPPDDPRYAGLELHQDEDVFDTWFSSNLWPFSTLGWPESEDPFYRKFYPTSVLVTGYDILFFWVARMEMAGYQLTDRAPFSHVLLHGLVLDEQGQKMSKSKGNGVDPLEVIDRYGADALRFATTYASTGGQDIRWDGRRVEMGRNFGNKLWNAARFAMMNLAGELDEGPPETLADRWILSRLQRATEEIGRLLESYDLGGATRAAYGFVWSEFCDWYLEAAKPALREDKDGKGARSRHILRTVLSDILRLLHPLTPFITSEIYEALGHDEQLGWASWPLPDERLIDREAERAFEQVQNAVAAARNLRAQAGLSPAQTLPLQLSGAAAEGVLANREVFAFLARAEIVATMSGASLSQVAQGLTVRLGLEGLVDVGEWRARQEKRLAELRTNADKSRTKLANAKFTGNAPKEVVEEERRRLAEAEELTRGLEAALRRLATP
jgi:valyl-tRNA synthetase